MISVCIFGFSTRLADELDLDFRHHFSSSALPRAPPHSRLRTLRAKISLRSGEPEVLQRTLLLRAMLLQAFYSIRSERLLMERLEYALLFR
jgi:hypothetical protein